MGIMADILYDFMIADTSWWIMGVNASCLQSPMDEKDVMIV